MKELQNFWDPATDNNTSGGRAHLFSKGDILMKNKSVNRVLVFSDEALILDYLYGDLDALMEEEIDGLICEDEELSIFYEDLMLYILKAGATKDQMREYLRNLKESAYRFNSEFAPCLKRLSNLIREIVPS